VTDPIDEHFRLVRDVGAEKRLRRTVEVIYRSRTDAARRL
jgi:hypothetical protein